MAEVRCAGAPRPALGSPLPLLPKHMASEDSAGAGKHREVRHQAKCQRAEEQETATFGVAGAALRIALRQARRWPLRRNGRPRSGGQQVRTLRRRLDTERMERPDMTMEEWNAIHPDGKGGG